MSVIKSLGFDNSVGEVGYSFTGARLDILKGDNAGRVQVPVAGYTLGNIILVFYSIGFADDVASGPVGSLFRAYTAINLGAGFRPIDQMPGFSVPSLVNVALLSVFSRVDAIIPAPLDVTSDPVVGLDILVENADTVRGEAWSVSLFVAEIDASSPKVVGVPTTVLSP